MRSRTLKTNKREVEAILQKQPFNGGNLKQICGQYSCQICEIDKIMSGEGGIYLHGGHADRSVATILEARQSLTHSTFAGYINHYMGNPLSSLYWRAFSQTLTISTIADLCKPLLFLGRRGTKHAFIRESYAAHKIERKPSWLLFDQLQTMFC